MKNLEYIIFACIFYEYEFFLQIESNIFDDLSKYYEILKELYGRGYTITREFFSKILKDRKIDNDLFEKVLDELSNEDDNFDYYLSEYLKVYNSKKILKVITENKGADNNRLVQEIQKALIEKKDVIKKTTMYDIMNDPNFEKIMSTVKIHRWFFDNFENGFRNEEFILIASRPSVGKSSESKQLALSCVVDRLKVGYFSLEVSSKRISKDLLANISYISKRDYFAGKLIENDKQYIQKAKEEMIDLSKNIWIEDKENIEINQLCRIADEMKRWGAKIIFIDYIQLISTYGMERKERRLQVDYISKKIKALSRKLEIPVVAMAQIHRLQDGKKHPGISDLKDCGGLEEDADIIILLSVEEWLDNENFTRCIVRNYVGKNRNGATGIYYTDFNRATGNIKDTKYDKAIVPKDMK